MFKKKLYSTGRSHRQLVVHCSVLLQAPTPLLHILKVQAGHTTKCSCLPNVPKALGSFGGKMELMRLKTYYAWRCSCPFMSHAKQVFLSVEPESVLVFLLLSESWSHMTFLEVVRDGYHDLSSLAFS